MGGWIKYFIVKSLSILGFFGTWYVSFELATTLAHTKYDYYLAAVIVTVMQASSFYFFVKARKPTRLKKTYWTISVLLFGISILGTLCYQFNMHTQESNNNYLNSEGYQSKKETKNSATSFVSDLKNDKKRTEESYSQQIKDLRNERDGLDPENYVSKRQQINDSIDALINEEKTIINKINEDIKGQNQKISQIGTSSGGEKVRLGSTKGYIEFTNKVGDWTGVSPSLLALIIQFLIAVTFEFTAIVLHLAADEEWAVISKKDKKVIVLEKARKQNNDISENDTKKFLDTLNDSKDSKGFINKSYKKIANEKLGFKESKSRRIYDQLKKAGKIKVVNGKTKIA